MIYFRYADQLAEQLCQKLTLEAKMEARASLAVDQRKEAIAEAARLGPATQQLIKQTRRLQGQVGLLDIIYFSASNTSLDST